MPELAGKITIDRKHSKVYVDGHEFPWHIAEQGPDVTSAAPLRGAPIIHLPVLARDVEIIPKGERSSDVLDQSRRDKAWRTAMATPKD